MRIVALLTALLAAALVAVESPQPAGAQPAVEARAVAPAGVRAPPGFRLIVANRDVRVNPGHRPALALLCPRAYSAVSWGFQVVNFTQTGPIAAVLQGVRPILRNNGVPAGWTFTIFNPAPVGTGLPVSARLQATCLQPIDGARVVGRGQRALGAAGGGNENPTLELGVVDRKVTGTSVRALCPRGEIAFSAGFSSDAGHELSGYVPIAGRRSGLELRFASQSAPARAVAARGGGNRLIAHNICGSGENGLTVSENSSQKKPRTGELKIETGQTSSLTASQNASGFDFTCGTPDSSGGFTPQGVNLGLGFEIKDLATPGRPAVSPTGRPLVVSWAHSPDDSTGRFLPWTRTFIVLPATLPIAVDLFFKCLKARTVAEATFRGGPAFVLRLERPAGVG